MHLTASRELEHLAIVSASSPTREEKRLIDLAGFMGVHVKQIDAHDSDSLSKQLLPESVSRCCLAITMERLKAIRNSSSDPAALLRLINERFMTVLVFGCNVTAPSDDTLSLLTGGFVSRVVERAGTSAREVCFELTASHQALVHPLTGLAIIARLQRPLAVFELHPTAAAKTAVMFADREPVFLRVDNTSCEIFLIAGLEVPDINARAFGEGDVKQQYHQLIPFLLFFRRAFGPNCWHTPQTTARFIIDDPLLTKTYGCLDYDGLFKSMRRLGYGTSIAFIPWNFRRTSARQAASLLCEGEHMSVCIHGCDHTNKEFESLDAAVLRQKAGLALMRMERHQSRTGLPFDDVMVFPQGRFSTQAVSALQDNNYLAAVNTTCLPIDTVPGAVSLSDLLRPAMVRFAGFPIFRRRYPVRQIDFAMDMLLGRPVLAGEHHEYFREGLGKLEEFVRKLQDMAPALSWPTLSAQLMQCCLVKRNSACSYEGQFFTRRFRLQNPRVDDCKFLLTKYEPDLALVRGVVVDGKAVQFGFAESAVQLEVSIGGCQRKEIEVLYHSRPAMPMRAGGLKYSIGVRFRRGLSEFRDNTLSRHRRLLSGAAKMAARLNLTGDAISKR